MTTSDGGIRTRVFVSSLTFTGDFATGSAGTDGLAGGDELCTTVADAKSLDGTWRAFLSAGTTRAADRLVGAGPWVQLDGGVVFNNKSAVNLALASGGLTNELGSPVTASNIFWSGTISGGGPATTTCASWGSNSGAVQGTYGTVAGSNFSWNGGTDLCSSARRLLCFEQAVVQADGGIRISPRPSGPPRRMFVSSITFAGNLMTAGGGASGPAGADLLCNQIVTARNLGGTWKAFLSTPTMRGVDRLTSTGPWVSLDGGSVFPNRTSLTLGLSTGPMTNDVGAPLTANTIFWSGTASSGQPTASTCSSWVSASGAVQGTYGSVAGSAFTWSSGTDICSSMRRLFCVED